MSLINIISVPTSSGVKSIEIHNDDLTKLSWDIDILVFSAYHNKYIPAPETVIKALEQNKNIIIEEHAENPLLDFRKSLHCWVSNKLTTSSIGHLLCIEGIKTDIELTGNAETSISSLFGTISLLPHKGVEAKTIALPILGTGYQGNDLEIVLPLLIDKAVFALNSIASLNTIYFIDIDETRSKRIEKLVNEKLKREDDILEKILEIQSLKPVFDRIKKKLLSLKSQNKRFKSNSIIDNLVSKILQKNLKLYELGILSRKLLEMIVKDLLPKNQGIDLTLNESINELTKTNVAPWMKSYIHIIRQFGNSLSHYSELSVYPESMDKTDITILVQSLDKVLDFHSKYPAFMKKEKTKL